MSETLQQMMFGLGAVPFSASRAASPAKMCPSPERERESTASGPGCGESTQGSSENSDPVGSLLRTCLLSELAVLTGCSATWKLSATPAGRSWWVLRTSAPSTGDDGSGSSLGPTPTVTGNNNRRGVSDTSGDGLATAIKSSLGPTPTAALAEAGAKSRSGARIGELLLTGRVTAAAMGPTPTVSDATTGGCYGRGNPKLSGAVRSMGCTPTANDAKNDSLPPAIGRRDTLAGDLSRLSDSPSRPPVQPPGGSTNGSPRGSSRPRLNAVWVAEYMGLPTSFGLALIARLYAFWETASSGRSRTRSQGRSTASTEGD